MRLRSFCFTCSSTCGLAEPQSALGLDLELRLY